MTNRSINKLGRWMALGFALLVLLGGAALVGSAASVEILGTDVSVDSNTDSVYADVNNTASTSANVTVTYESVNSSGNVTGTLGTQSMTVAAGSVQMSEHSSINASAYDSVRVSVSLDNTTASSDNVTASAGTFQKTTGGGGGFSLDGMSSTEKAIALAAVVGLGAMLMKED